MVDGNDVESAASSHFGNYGHILGVNSAKLRVMCILGNLHIVVAILSFGRFTIDMTEL